MRLFVPTFFICFLFTQLVDSKCLSSLESHCIESLPGLSGPLSSDQYSGYLDAGEGSHFFYWLIESSNAPNTDPLILWLNGGPGCSSLEGLFTESGPYTILKDGTVASNPNSWTRFANMLYVDTPDCVGFSYSDNFTCHDVFYTSDDNVTRSNFAALKSFFKLHERFRQHEIYFFGESYGSFYVSLLADRVLEEKYKLNLAGVIIANGVLDEDLDIVTTLQYYFYHGFIDQPLLNEIIFKCESQTTYEGSLLCFRKERQYIMLDLINTTNLYHIFHECVHEESISFEFKTQAFLCVQNSYTANYLNKKEVQEKIHVSSRADLVWSTCQIDSFQLVDKIEPAWPHKQYLQQYRSMKPVLQRTIERGVRVFFMFGDSDAICNFLTGQLIADYLGTKLSSRHVWPGENKAFGFLTSYTGHYFATVLGAGHMSPRYKPMESAAFVEAFINKTLA